MTYEEALAVATANNEIDENQTFLIDKNLRTVTIPDGFVLGVFNDKNVQIVPFAMPRYYNGIDMSLFAIQINYVNSNGDGDIYLVFEKDVQDDLILFNWVVDRTAFATTGRTGFVVCMKEDDEYGYVEREFNTTLTYAPVLEGLEIENPIDDQTAMDILTQIIQAANRADEAADDAEASSNSAGASASNASSSASSASTSASNASASATAAAASAATASSAETNAVSARDAAIEAAQAAAQSAASLTVDTELSSTSTNPVQNKVIDATVTELKNDLSSESAQFSRAFSVGGNINSSGEINTKTSATYSATEFIPCDKTSYVYLKDITTQSWSQAYAFYRSDLSYISGVANVSGDIFLTPNDIPDSTKFIRCSSKIVSGKTPEAYVFNNVEIEKELHTAVSVLKHSTYSQSDFGWELGSLVDGTGEEQNSTTRIRSVYIPAQAGTVVTVSGADHSLVIYEFDANKGWLKNTAFADNNIQLVTNSETAFIRILIRNGNATITQEEVSEQGARCSVVLAIPREAYLLNGLIADIKENANNVHDLERALSIEEYSPSSTYAINDYAKHNGNYYRCIIPVTTPGGWSSNAWKEISIADEFIDLKTVQMARAYGYDADITGDVNTASSLIRAAEFLFFDGQKVTIKNNAASNIIVSYRTHDAQLAFPQVSVPSGGTVDTIISGSPEYINIYSVTVGTPVNIHLKTESLVEYVIRNAPSRTIFDKYAEQIANCICGADYYRGGGILTGNKNLSIMMVSDTHFDYDANKNAIQLAEGMDSIDCIVHLGDVSSETATAKSGTNPFITSSVSPSELTKPLFVAMGNHDEQHKKESADYGTVAQGVARLLPNLNTASTYNNRGYGYYDFTAYNVRMILLNCFDYPDSVTGTDYDYYGDSILWQQDQIDFLVATLKTVPEGYTVIIASHYSELANIDNQKIDQHPGAKNIASITGNTQIGNATYMSDVVVSDIINAYKNKTALNKSYTYSNGTKSGNVVVDDTFASSYGDFAIWICGHRHKACIAKSSVGDYWVYVNDTSGCGSDANSWITAYSNQPRCAETNLRDLITVMSIDTANKYIKFTRIGAHINRFLDDDNLFLLYYGETT